MHINTKLQLCTCVLTMFLGFFFSAIILEMDFVSNVLCHTEGE